MVKLVISFYPGGGGNRYYLYTKGRKDFLPKKTYDDLVQNQPFEYRYITRDSLLHDLPVVLTHCVNTSILKKNFPEHEIIVIKTDLKESLLREWKIDGHDRYINKMLKLKNDLSVLEHYNSIKDNSWPSIDRVEDLSKLSSKIQKEVFEDRQKHICNETRDPVAILKKEIIEEIESAYETIAWHQQYYRLTPLDLSVANTIIDIDDETNDFCVMMRKEVKSFHSDIFDRAWSLSSLDWL